SPRDGRSRSDSWLPPCWWRGLDPVYIRGVSRWWMPEVTDGTPGTAPGEGPVTTAKHEGNTLRPRCRGVAGGEVRVRRRRDGRPPRGRADRHARTARRDGGARSGDPYPSRHRRRRLR